MLTKLIDIQERVSSKKLNVLIATVFAPGHVNPALAIASELIRRGHSISWYTGKAFQQTIEKLGARFLPMQAAKDLDHPEIQEIFKTRAKYEGIEQYRYSVNRLFVDQIPTQYADLRALLEEGDASYDLLLTDNGMLGALPFEHARKVPWAVFGIMPLNVQSIDTAPFRLGLKPSSSFFGRLRNRILNWYVNDHFFRGLQKNASAQLMSLGFSPFRRSFLSHMVTGPDMFFQATSEDFEYKRSDLPSKVKFVGPLLPEVSKGQELPKWWKDLDSGKPIIHVAQGTVDNNDFNKLVLPTIRAFAKEDVLVVVSTGKKPLAEFPMKDLPANVRIAEFIPYDLLMKKVDVMITNGGYGGVQFALANGVPLVVAANTEEKPEIGQRVVWSGAGIFYRKSYPSERQLKKAVTRILKDPAYKNNAVRIQKSYEQYDTTRLIAENIEKYIAER